MYTWTLVTEVSCQNIMYSTLFMRYLLQEYVTHFVCSIREI